MEQRGTLPTKERVTPSTHECNSIPNSNDGNMITSSMYYNGNTITYNGNTNNSEIHGINNT